MARPKPETGVDPDAPTVVNAARIIPRRVAELLSWEQYIGNPERVAELHMMRIAAKRLRYTMEFFAPFYGTDFRAAINQFKKIQEQLGSIHDADVLVPQLARYLDQTLRAAAGSRKDDEPVVGVRVVDLDAAQGLLTLCKKYRDEREQVYKQFLITWSGLRADGFFDRLWVIVQRGAAEIAAANSAPAQESVKTSPDLDTLEGAGEGGTDDGSKNGIGSENGRHGRRAHRAGKQNGVVDPNGESATARSRNRPGPGARIDSGSRPDSGEGA